MINFHIRPYAESDKPFLLEILQKNIPTYFAPDELPDLVHYLDQEVEAYFVVEAAGVVVGAGGINFRPEERAAYLSWDFLDPAIQGKGAGTQLWLYRAEFLRTIFDLEKVVVRTSQKAWRFYEKLGFELKCIEENYWAPGFDLYYMEVKYSRMFRREVSDSFPPTPD